MNSECTTGPDSGDVMAQLSELFPCLYDTATGSLRLRPDTEAGLKAAASHYGVQLGPIRSQQDLAMALVYAMIGKSLHEIEKECSINNQPSF